MKTMDRKPIAPKKLSQEKGKRVPKTFSPKSITIENKFAATVKIKMKIFKFTRTTFKTLEFFQSKVSLKTKLAKRLAHK